MNDVEFNSIMEEIAECNKYITNHVGQHTEDNIRKGILVVQIFILTFLLIL